MGKKIAIAAGGGCVLLVAAWLGGTAYVGTQLKERLQQAPRSWQAQWPMVKLVEQHYERGLFSATHRATLQFGCDGAPGAPQVTLVQHVRHGPLAGTTFAAAVVDTELQLPEAGRQALAAQLGTRAPLAVHTVVGFGGATRSELVMPAWRTGGKKDVQVDFQGLRAELDETAGHVRYDLRLPGVTLRGPDGLATGSFVLTDARLHGELQGAGAWWLRPGHAEGGVASLSVSVTPPDAAASGPSTLSLEQATYRADSTVRDGLMDSTARVAMRGMFGTVRLDRFEMEASLKRLHVAGYARLVQRVLDTGATACGMQQQVSPQVLLAQLQEDVFALLPHNPQYAIDKLVIESGGQRGELSYSVGVDGVTAQDRQLPLPALAATRGRLQGRANVPLAWLRATAAWYPMPRGADGPPDPALQAEMFELGLAQMIERGVLVRDGEQLRAEFSFDKGDLRVNGKPLEQGMH